MKITKNRYLMSFVAIVLILAMIRLIFPDVAKDKNVNRPVVVNDALNDSSINTLGKKDSVGDG